MVLRTNGKKIVALGQLNSPDSLLCVAQETSRYSSENSSAQQYNIAEDCKLNTAENKSPPNSLSLISMQLKNR